MGPGTYAKPNLSPDDKDLFLFENNTSTFLHASNTGSGWSAVTAVTELNSHYPGTPAMVGGQLEMVLEDYVSNEFDEYRYSGSRWDLIRTYDSRVLAEAVGGTIAYPSLSADGQLLVFQLTNAGNLNGVRYIRRPDATMTFNADIQHNGMLVPGTTIRSAYLTSDCNHLYAIDGSATLPALLRFD